jgi:hypothetical protein
MKAPIAISLALASVLALPAHAYQCTANRVTDMSTIVGKLICAYKSAATNANDRWSEVLSGAGTGGTLIEWARGPGDTVDPSQSVGTWSIDDTADTVTFVYPDGSYSYSLYSNGDTTYSLCGGSGTPTVTQIVTGPSGANPCGWAP